MSAFASTGVPAGDSACRFIETLAHEIAAAQSGNSSEQQVLRQALRLSAIRHAGAIAAEKLVTGMKGLDFGSLLVKGVEADRDGRQIVMTSVDAIRGDDSFDVDWLVTGQPGRETVVDVSIDDVSIRGRAAMSG